MQDPYEEQDLGLSSLWETEVEIMATVNALFDESGKFTDHQVISFGGLACYAIHMKSFAQDWDGCLRINGLKSLTMKVALNHSRPFSDVNPALGIDARNEALIPFMQCIRKHLQVITGTAVDANAFANLASHYHQILGKDPFFTAFLRVVLDILELTHDDDKLTVICDDEEAMALPMFKFYRRIKLVDIEARKKLKGICFADDEFLYALQAADLVSSLMRMEAGKRFHQTPYDYEQLFSAMTKQPDHSSEKIWACRIGFADRDQLQALADDLKKRKDDGTQETKAEK